MLQSPRARKYREFENSNINRNSTAKTFHGSKTDSLVIDAAIYYRGTFNIRTFCRVSERIYCSPRKSRIPARDGDALVTYRGRVIPRDSQTRAIYDPYAGEVYITGIHGPRAYLLETPRKNLFPLRPPCLLRPTPVELFSPQYRRSIWQRSNFSRNEPP